LYLLCLTTSGRYRGARNFLSAPQFALLNTWSLQARNLLGVDFLWSTSQPFLSFAFPLQDELILFSSDLSRIVQIARRRKSRQKLFFSARLNRASSSTFLKIKTRGFELRRSHAIYIYIYIGRILNLSLSFSEVKFNAAFPSYFRDNLLEPCVGATRGLKKEERKKEHQEGRRGRLEGERNRPDRDKINERGSPTDGDNVVINLRPTSRRAILRRNRSIYPRALLTLMNC